MAKDKDAKKPEEDGFTPVVSADGASIYVKMIPGGCEKRTITENGDTSEFIQGAYIREWTVDGNVFRNELMGGK